MGGIASKSMNTNGLGMRPVFVMWAYTYASNPVQMDVDGDVEACNKKNNGDEGGDAQDIQTLIAAVTACLYSRLEVAAILIVQAPDPKKKDGAGHASDPYLQPSQQSLNLGEMPIDVEVFIVPHAGNLFQEAASTVSAVPV